MIKNYFRLTQLIVSSSFFLVTIAPSFWGAAYTSLPVSLTGRITLAIVCSASKGAQWWFNDYWIIIQWLAIERGNRYVSAAARLTSLLRNTSKAKALTNYTKYWQWVNRIFSTGFKSDDHPVLFSFSIQLTLSNVASVWTILDVPHFQMVILAWWLPTVATIAAAINGRDSPSRKLPGWTVSVIKRKLIFFLQGVACLRCQQV